MGRECAASWVGGFLLLLLRKDAGGGVDERWLVWDGELVWGMRRQRVAGGSRRIYSG